MKLCIIIFLIISVRMQSLSICNKKTGDKCFQSCIATGQKAMATSENFNHKQVKAFSYEGGEAIAQGD